MMTRDPVVAMLVLLFTFCAAYAQRGAGESQGLARQGAQPELVQLEGEVAEIHTHTCQHTTGHAVIGTHLILMTPESKSLNVHLGSAEALRPKIATLHVGDAVHVTAFRTDKLAEDQYIAKQLAWADQVLELRDDRLRPVWAGRPGRGLGRGRGDVSHTTPPQTAASGQRPAAGAEAAVDLAARVQQLEDRLQQLEQELNRLRQLVIERTRPPQSSQDVDQSPAAR